MLTVEVKVNGARKGYLAVQNDGTGTEWRASYDVTLYVLRDSAAGTPLARARVEDFDRSMGPLALAAIAFEEIEKKRWRVAPPEEQPK